MKKNFIVLLFILFYIFNTGSSIAQKTDSSIIRQIYSEALTSFVSYENLRLLCKNIGSRLTGSENANDAVSFVENILKDMNMDTVFRQSFAVRNWVRGEKEYGYAFNGSGFKKEFNVCALGTSVGTGDKGVSGKIIEVKTFEELKQLGRNNIEGKIIFFNREADQRGINTGYGYGSSVDQRVRGAIEAAKYGAIAVIVRSSTVALDDYPHTGIMRYVDTLEKIPAIGISTLGADELSKINKEMPDLNFYFRTTCHQNADVTSYNIIGEIKGTEYPDEIILIGSHLDSWDLAEGAQDDGGGLMQCIEVLRLFKVLNISPKHTIRFVGFMDEEIDQKGARYYANEVSKLNEKHIAAIETDGGVDTPFGFGIENSDSNMIQKLKSFSLLFEPYGLYYFKKSWSGVDISFLKNTDAALIGLVTDSQRYFDAHHSSNDVFENINRREMQLGAASIASLVFLIDKYGIK